MTGEVTTERRGAMAFPVGLGCMGLSGMYGPTADDDGVRVIQAAIDHGVTLLDTGDFYGMGHNERLVGRALAGRRDRVAVSVKFGALRGPDGAWNGVDARPVAVKNFAAYSLDRLGLEVIDVYRPARLDPAVPIEDTVGAIAELVEKGYVRAIGLSEVGAATVRRAHAVHPIADVQIEYSILSRGPETTLFPTLEALGVSATLYGVLSRGLLTGSTPRGQTDFRAYLPRFTGEAGEHNRRLADAFADFGRARGLSPAQLAIAWARAKQPRFVPLLGARTLAQLEDGLGRLDAVLGPDDLAALDALVPPDAAAGTRYPEAQMAHLDSERDA